MSSVQNTVTEIEEQYRKIKDDFQKYVKSIPKKVKEATEYEKYLNGLTELNKAVLHFQKSILYQREKAIDNIKDKSLRNKVIKSIDEVLEKLTTEKSIYRVPSFIIPPYNLSDEFPVAGVISSLK
ncbi:hypothetical protein ACFLRN_10455, partial [Thermoproteota archaeon]